MKQRPRETTTELWADKNGLLKVIFVENEWRIEGKCNLYVCFGGPGMIINLKILANDLVKFLNEWHESKKVKHEPD